MSQLPMKALLLTVVTESWPVKVGTGASRGAAHALSAISITVVIRVECDAQMSLVPFIGAVSLADLSHQVRVSYPESD